MRQPSGGTFVNPLQSHYRRFHLLYFSSKVPKPLTSLSHPGRDCSRGDGSWAGAGCWLMTCCRGLAEECN